MDELLSLRWRVANALISYVSYLGQTFYPTGLAVYYPRRGSALPDWEVVGALLLVLSVTFTVLAWRRRFPYLVIGWFWYLGMLVPVIGLVPFGQQSEADRFTYLPQVGLSIALRFAAATRARLVSSPRSVRAGGGGRAGSLRPWHGGKPRSGGIAKRS